MKPSVKTLGEILYAPTPHTETHHPGHPNCAVTFLAAFISVQMNGAYTMGKPSPQLSNLVGKQLQWLRSYQHRTLSLPRDMHCDRRPKRIEHSHDCLRLSVLYLHFSSPEVEHCKSAFEEEATLDDVRKAASGLYVDAAAVLPTVVHNQLQRAPWTIEGGHNRLDPLQHLFLCIAHKHYLPKRKQNLCGGRIENYILQLISRCAGAISCMSATFGLFSDSDFLLNLGIGLLELPLEEDSPGFVFCAKQTIWRYRIRKAVLHAPKFPKKQQSLNPIRRPINRCLVSLNVEQPPRK